MKSRLNDWRILFLRAAVPAAAVLFLLPATSQEDFEDLPETVECNRDIRPGLSNKCFACPRPGAVKREGHLLTFRHPGRDFRLSDGHGKAARDIPGLT